MIGRYAVTAGRIRQDLGEIERVVQRAERAMTAARLGGDNRDLFVDSAALNLHDFYSGLERVFEHIASNIDRSTPSSRDWHRELLRQMTVEVQGLRPRIISASCATALDEYLRFRHVVRNVYAFEFDPTRIETLVNGVRPAFECAKDDLLTFSAFLESLAQED